jgi:hypothetical protein
MSSDHDSFEGPGGPAGLTGLRDKLHDLDRQLDELRRDLAAFTKDTAGGFVPFWAKPMVETAINPNVIAPGIGIPAWRPFRIYGIELTQSIQYFNYSKQGSGLGPDNSVPLIADKEMIVRAYLDPGMAAYFGFNVRCTGRVRIGDRTYPPLNGPVAISGPAMVSKRTQWDSSLNFRLPAHECRGTIKLSVEVWRENQNVLYETATTVTAEFHRTPRIRVTGVLIHFTGNNQDLAAPTGNDLVNSLGRFLPMFPTPGYDFGPCTVMDYSGDLTVKKGWDDLLNTIVKMRAASTVRTYYFGLLPANTPAMVGTNTRGIGTAGVAVGAKDDSRALCHEFGHALRLDHVDACGAPAPFDDDYPKYPIGAFGSIGECGIDTRRLTLFDPATARDLMTYCDNPAAQFPPRTWISPHNYLKTMDGISSSQGTGDYVQVAAVGGTLPFLMLNFRLYRDGRLQIRPSYVIDGVAPAEGARCAVPVIIDVLDGQGEAVDSHRCHRLNPYQDPDGPYVDYCEMIPWRSEGRNLRFVRRGEVLATLDLQERGPEVRLRPLDRVERHGDLLRLEWEADGAAESLVRYTNDGGRTWTSVAAGLTETRLVLDLDLLPGGDECRLQVLCSAGLGSTAVESDSFQVRRKPRRAYIVTPPDGEAFRVGEPVNFTGAGHSPDLGVSAFEDVTWSSSLAGVLGGGYQVTRDDLRAGTHRIGLSVPDGHGGESTASVWIRIEESPQRPPECTSGHESPPSAKFLGST